MKHFLLAGLCLILLTGRLQASVRIAGKFKNPVSDSIMITTAEGTPVAAGRHHPKHGFAFELRIADGFYFIGDGNEHTEMYLRDGFDLYLTLNTKAFDETVKWKGSGAAENNYLAAKLLLEEKLESISDYRYYAKKTESAFLSLMDSLETVRLKLLNSYHKELYPDFFAMQKTVIVYDKKSKLHTYESMHAFLSGDKTFKVSEQFPSPFSDIEFNHSEWVNIFEYTDVISDYLYNLASKDSGVKHGRDYYLVYLEQLEKHVQSKPIQSKLAAHIGLYRLNYCRHQDSVYNKILSLVTDTAEQSAISRLYSKIRNLKKGIASHSFSFPDRQGLLHTLESLRGKLVYIDVWATWCGPCIAEMPALAKLQDSLKGKDIVFVSICTWDERQNWDNFLEKRKPEGLQLFAENGKDPFLEAYVIQGVPRFILLDREGRIIDANAKRPSNEHLLPEILDLLK